MTTTKPAGYDAKAYSLREKGYSSNPIRESAFSLIEKDLHGTVLDAGSGEGGWIKFIKDRKKLERITSVDIVDDGVSSISDVEFHICDLSHAKLPCGENTLDWVFAIEVLEHLANPRHFINQSFRCLKPGGKLLITTPCNDSLRARLSYLFRGYFPAFCEHDYLSAGHITPITEFDLIRMSNEMGFSKVDIFYPLPGRIPKLDIEWQKIIPWFNGKLWSDTLFAILTK